MVDKKQRGRARVLVVDDEPDVIEALQDIFDGEPVALEGAGSYEAARERLRSGAIDVAVLDIMGVRGYELLREFGARLPCIMLTGKALSVADLRESFGEGAALYVPKERLGDLPECVARVLAARARLDAAPAAELPPAPASRLPAPAGLAPPAPPWRSLWRWFADRVDLGRWIGSGWSEADPALAQELNALRQLRHTALLAELPEPELQLLAELAEPFRAAAGDVVCRAGEPSDAGLYLLISGAVRIEEPRQGSGEGMGAPAGGRQLLEAGEVFGEGTLLLGLPAARSVRASTAVSGYRIAHSAFEAHLAELPVSTERLLARLRDPQPSALVGGAVELVQHLRAVQALYRRARAELELVGQRRSLEQLLVIVIGGLSAIAFLLAALRRLDWSPLLAARGIELMIAAAAIAFLRRSRLSLAEVGWTTRNWRRAVGESLAFAAVAAALATAGRYLAVTHLPALHGAPLLVMPHFGWMSVVYLLGAPLQEFVMRGVLQTALEQLLSGPWRTHLAVVLAALLYGVGHLHYGLTLGLCTFALGLGLGWLFARHRTLLGVTLAHLLIGEWVMNALDGVALMARLLP
ncbi:MAG: hypothetical protein KatS3mg102_0891 [Planctomycetota bacterium]|nr:MAG: hypothetical protein KatS3mg102_0891 [Planctomycetota bacterium]